MRSDPGAGAVEAGRGVSDADALATFDGAPPMKGVRVPVQVNLPTVLRNHAGGAKSVQADGSTVGEVLRDLELQFPGLSGQVIGDDGHLHKFVNVYVNDDDVRYLAALDTAVGPFDELTILPAVAGGSDPSDLSGSAPSALWSALSP